MIVYFRVTGTQCVLRSSLEASRGYPATYNHNVMNMHIPLKPGSRGQGQSKGPRKAAVPVIAYRPGAQFTSQATGTEAQEIYEYSLPCDCT